MKELHFTNGLNLRPSKASDQAFIEALFRSTREFILQADAERDYLETVIEQQLELQSNSYEKSFPQAMVFIVEYLHEKIGRVVVDFGSNVAHLVDLMFIPQARGKGFGTSIIQSLQTAAQQINIPMTLVVDQSNLLAKQLYLKMGFIIQSVKPPSELMAWYPVRPSNTFKTTK